LVVTETSYPVLIPGVDLLNHARAHAVTWEVSPLSSGLSLALKQHLPTSQAAELFNNYGPKSNASLILGYGFALENNPDDTITLKMGGTSTSHEVGRSSTGADTLWTDLRHVVLQSIQEEGQQRQGDDNQDLALTFDVDLQTAEVLSEMVETLLERIPSAREMPTSRVRQDVLTMWKWYVRGQRDILEDLLRWTRRKEKEVLAAAKEVGIQFEAEDDE